MAVYRITFCDHVKNVKKILCEYDRVNRPSEFNENFEKIKIIVNLESNYLRQIDTILKKPLMNVYNLVASINLQLFLLGFRNLIM